MVSIARSGDSPESMAVVERTHRLRPEVWHLAITCNARGGLATSPLVNSIILDPRTNDESLVMTSSFSNLLLAGLCLARGESMKPRAVHVNAIGKGQAARLVSRSSAGISRTEGRRGASRESGV